MGSVGTGHRLLNAGFPVHSDEPEPLEGQHPQSSPEQDCLEVGGFGPVRVIAQG
jgi:hypothetical protein